MKKAKSKSSFPLTSLSQKSVLLIFVVIFAVFGGIALLVSTMAAPKTRTTVAAVSMSMDPASGRYRVGDTVNLAVKINTNGKTVNAAQADISYPAANFDFVAISAANSPFDMEAPSSGGNGQVSVARFTTGPLNGSDLLLATVQLRAKAPGRKLVLKFLDGSAVIDYDQSMNILERKVDAKFDIQ